MKLKEQYGESIYIAEGEGLDDIVTMRENTSQILQSYFKCTNKDGDEESQKRAILETAARLIKSDIKINVPSNSPVQMSLLLHCFAWYQSNGCFVWGKVHRTITIFTLQSVCKETIFSKIICDTRTSAPYCILNQISLSESALPDQGLD